MKVRMRGKSISKLILKIIWKDHMKVSKNIMKIMNHERKLTQSGRIYYKAIIIKAIWYLYGNSFINGTG